MNQVTKCIAVSALNPEFYFMSYLVSKEKMVAILSKKRHIAKPEERLHLSLIGIPIPYGVPVEICPPGHYNFYSGIRQDLKTHYYIRVNPIMKTNTYRVSEDYRNKYLG